MQLAMELRIWAVPTSSTRTLLAWAGPDAGACVVREESSRYIHQYLVTVTCRLWKVARSIGLSNLVQQSRHELS